MEIAEITALMGAAIVVLMMLGMPLVFVTGAVAVVTDDKAARVSGDTCGRSGSGILACSPGRSAHDPRSNPVQLE